MASSSSANATTSSCATSYTSTTSSSEHRPPLQQECCSYCYATPPPKLSKCSLCHKRLYCSRTCQRLDWKYKPTSHDGQTGGGHGFWCAKGVGEIGHAVSIPWLGGEKGFGMVALMDIKKGHVICVERAVLKAPHEVTQEQLDELLLPLSLKEEKASLRTAIQQLGPYSADATLSQKFLNNRMKITPKESALFVTLARINHSCLPNAAHFHDHYHSGEGVEVLVATCDIKSGQEITINYASHLLAEQRALVLKDEYGFVCDCRACGQTNDELETTPRQLRQELDQTIQLDDDIGQLTSDKKITEATESAHKLLQLYVKLEMSDTYLARTHFDLFQLKMMQIKLLQDDNSDNDQKKDAATTDTPSDNDDNPKQDDTTIELLLQDAAHHIEQAHQFALDFFGYPEHPLVQHYQYYKDHPQKHPYYPTLLSSSNQ